MLRYKVTIMSIYERVNIFISICKKKTHMCLGFIKPEGSKRLISVRKGKKWVSLEAEQSKILKFVDVN